MLLNTLLFFALSVLYAFQIQLFFQTSFNLVLVGGVVAGTCLGLILGFILTQNMLNKLINNQEWPSNLKTLFVAVGTFVLIVPVFIEFFIGISSELQSVVFFALISFGVALSMVRTILLITWERRNKRVIFQDFFGFYVYLNGQQTTNSQSNWASYQEAQQNNYASTLTAKRPFGNNIRGWYPQEPQFSQSSRYPSEKKRSIFDTPLSELNTGTLFSLLVGALVLALGLEALVFIDEAVAILQSIAILMPVAGLLGYFFGFWLAVGGAIVLLVLTLTKIIGKAFWKRNFSPRRLMPYALAAAIFYLGYLVSQSGVQFAYAIPIAFIVSGIIALRGLNRFTVTFPAFIVVLVSMLFFGTAFAGVTAVTYVNAEDHYLTTADAPKVTTLNMSTYSMEGNINVYFTDNASEICHVAFIEQYGVVPIGLGTQHLGERAYDRERAPQFNYTIEDNQANVTVWADTVLVNITVNQNVKLNIDLSTYYGTLNLHAQSNANNLQKVVLFSALGDINLNVGDTTNLQNLAAQANRTLDAQISSRGQNQNSTVLLIGGTVKLDLNLALVNSEINAYQLSEWGSLQAQTEGFTVLSHDDSFFKAQTPNFAFSDKWIEVTATSHNSMKPSMDITANNSGGG
jgi:hypothetical protein